MKPKILIPILLLAAVAFFIGRSTGSHSGHAGHDHGVESSASEVRFWTCSMHPEVRQPGPGKCPKCAMDLIPVTSGSGPQLPVGQIALRADAIQRAGIPTAPVRREMPTVDVRMSGRIAHDETRLAYITARFPGRLDRLFVDYTGVQVKQGDHLVEIYSPELLAAEEELIQAIQTANELKNTPNELLRQRAQETIKAAREKLVLWGLTSEQVDAIEKKQTLTDRLTVYAPAGGIVIRKEAVEGKYVETGAPIYTIADLDHVWVLLDAYESDLAWLHFGQDVSFSVEAHPGESFEGRIAFIDPVLNPETRTVRVRVNVENHDRRLKPGMFVNAVVRSRVLADGKVMNQELAGKWISPMHPEIVKDAPGDCPVCGMALVSAESLGYLPAGVDNEKIPLVVPASAPLITGKRAVVYVELPRQPGHFEARVIELGPKAGDQYIVRSGLKENELVVTHGAFKIDSAVQILAGPSMMNGVKWAGDEGRGAKGVERHEAPVEFIGQLQYLISSYFPVSDALSHDKQTDAAKALEIFEEMLGKVDMSLLEHEAHMAWMKHLKQVKTGVTAMKESTEIKAMRKGFESISQGVIAAADAFGIKGDHPLYVYHCPMAAGGKGADWLQMKQGTENPYFGSSMFNCGDEVRVLGEGRRGEGLGTMDKGGGK